MKILVTGFEPFGGQSINPSWEAVKRLDKNINENEIISELLPCAFIKSGQVLDDLIFRHKPNFVLCVGQAGGRADLSIEKVAINIMSGCDNENYSPSDEAIKISGETAYFSTLPVKAIVAAIRASGLSASVSYSAGIYVCNYVMYESLYLAKTKYKDIKTGFMHVPFIHEQLVQQQLTNSEIKPPAMSVNDITNGLSIAISVIFNSQNDISTTEGKTH